jgi:hypothetical protein
MFAVSVSAALLALATGGQSPGPTLPAGVDEKWLLPPAVLAAPGSLVAEFEALVAMRYEAAGGDSPYADAASFADLVAAVRDAADSGTSVEDAIAAARRERRDVAPRTFDVLGELLRDSALRARDWRPDRDSKDDGIVLAEPLDLDALRPRLSTPWNELEGSRLLQQGAVFLPADMAAIKAKERDYARYLQRPGSDYESIGMVEDSFVTTDSHTFHRVAFECDLPFPFTTYECDLVVLDRIDPHGRIRCDVYSTSDDFHWLAGADVYLPLTTSEGRFLGHLLVRLFGFDLDDVPDGDSDRQTALRSGIGNLKREP